MSNSKQIKLFLVDDDSILLKLMEIEFLQLDEFLVETFSTGELCLAHFDQKPDIVILDYHLDGVVKNAMNGIETLDKIKAINKDIPVIMLSSQDKIDVAINCMHHKALDYVMKSETSFMRLRKIISDFLEHQKMEKQLSWYMDRM